MNVAVTVPVVPGPMSVPHGVGVTLCWPIETATAFCALTKTMTSPPVGAMASVAPPQALTDKPFEGTIVFTNPSSLVLARAVVVTLLMAGCLSSSAALDATKISPTATDFAQTADVEVSEPIPPGNHSYILNASKGAEIAVEIFEGDASAYVHLSVFTPTEHGLDWELTVNAPASTGGPFSATMGGQARIVLVAIHVGKENVAKISASGGTMELLSTQSAQISAMHAWTTLDTPPQIRSFQLSASYSESGVGGQSTSPAWIATTQVGMLHEDATQAERVSLSFLVDLPIEANSIAVRWDRFGDSFTYRNAGLATAVEVSVGAGSGRSSFDLEKLGAGALSSFSMTSVTLSTALAVVPKNPSQGNVAFLQDSSGLVCASAGELECRR